MITTKADCEQVNLPVVAGHVVHDLCGAIHNGTFGLGAVPELIKRVLRENLWRDRIVQSTKRRCKFQTFAEFISSPLPKGLGTDLRTLKNLCRDDTEALDLVDRVTQGKHGGDRESTPIKNNIVNLAPGNSRANALRRLRKDRPDLHSDVLAGKLTAHGAMVEAGFRRKPTALEELKRLWLKASKAERKRFLDEIK